MACETAYRFLNIVECISHWTACSRVEKPKISTNVQILSSGVNIQSLGSNQDEFVKTLILKPIPFLPSSTYCIVLAASCAESQL